MRTKYQALLAILLFCFAIHASARDGLMPARGLVDAATKYADLSSASWQHGAESCQSASFAAIQVQRVNANSYVLRQDKCVTFEAPFIYVLIGQDKVLVVDTGANEDPEESPIYQTIKGLIDKHDDGGDKSILVVHSHGHGDHTAGDVQFIGKPNVEVVSTEQRQMTQHLGLNNWPFNASEIDLGNRKLTIIPIPGHQDQSIAIYDHQTQWLLTGDTFYPGLIRVKNWGEFRASIARLVEFSDANPVSLVLGSHIEMNTLTKDIYKIGSTYQPNEPPLALNIAHLKQLNEKLQANAKPKKLKFDLFVISPLNRFEKMLSNLLQ